MEILSFFWFLIRSAVSLSPRPHSSQRSQLVTLRTWQELDQQGILLANEEDPFQCANSQKGKIRHIDMHRCTNTHSQFCIASSCRNIQVQISADDRNSLCSLWTTRSVLSDFVFPRLLKPHEYFCSAQLNRGYSRCFIALFTFSWMFSWSVAQQTIN